MKALSAGLFLCPVVNTNTKQLAENISAKRQIAVQNQEYDFVSDYKRQACLIQFFSDLVDKRKNIRS